MGAKDKTLQKYLDDLQKDLIKKKSEIENIYESINKNQIEMTELQNQEMTLQNAIMKMMERSKLIQSIIDENGG
jgi:predicted  nucleic acid-binding Zn-ribbon protein